MTASPKDCISVTVHQDESICLLDAPPLMVSHLVLKVMYRVQDSVQTKNSVSNNLGSKRQSFVIVQVDSERKSTSGAFF